jgi:hypothetical protein
MAICSSTCAPALPASYSGGCGITSRPGGIKRLWFVKCDAEDWDFTDDAEWETAQTSVPPVVVGSGLIMGQKAKGSFTKKRIASCMPEGIVGAEKQITFSDYNTDTVTSPGPGCLAYTFWNTILTNSSNYKLIYETCDGYVVGPISDFILEIDEVIEDNNTGSTYFDGTITWNDIEMTCPAYVVGGNGVTPA